MKPQKKHIQLILWINIVFLIGNISYSFSYKFSKKTTSTMAAMAEIKEFVESKLSLKSEQKTLFYDATISYHKKQSELKKSLINENIKMLNLMASNAPHKDSLVLLAKKSGVLHEELKRLTIAYHFETMSLLTPQQQNKFKEIYIDIIKDIGK